MPNPERMTAQEAAEYIGTTPYTIYKFARQKNIPHWRIGRYVRFSKSALDKWIKDQQDESIAN